MSGKSALCALLIFAASCTTARPVDDAESAVSATRAFVDALAALDLERVVAAFDDEASVYFPTDIPLRADGRAAIRQGFAAVIDQAKKAGLSRINLKPEDFRAQTFGDLAVVTFHLKYERSVSRRTAVLRRDGQHWVMIHLHASNMQTK